MMQTNTTPAKDKRELNSSLIDKEKIEILLRSIKNLLDKTGEICEYCSHYIPCAGEACDCFEAGVGATSVETGEHFPDMKWTCMDWELGACQKYEGTICGECLQGLESANFAYNWKPVLWEAI